MDQIWKDDCAVPVTIIKTGDCVVTQIKTKEKDGYESVVLGFDKITKENKITKTMKGKEYKHLKEFDLEGETKIGDVISIKDFEIGDKVIIRGISKGKGYQGPVKRWGFKGGIRTHGTKHTERQQGSIGCRFPQRATKGVRMAGRMGQDLICKKNVEIVKIDVNNNLIFVKGALPGGRGALLKIEV